MAVAASNPRTDMGKRKVDMDNLVVVDHTARAHPGRTQDLVVLLAAHMGAQVESILAPRQVC